MQTWLPYVFVVIIVGLVLWFRLRGRTRPVKGNGWRLLLPVPIVLVVMALSLSQLMHIPGKPFQVPAAWEILIALLLGCLFGGIMLNQTSYEKREDGLIYPKPNKYFKYILIALVVIRIVLSQYFKTLDPVEFAVLGMVFAFLYICVWRIGSFIKFQKVTRGEGREIRV
ncbi:cytochrome c biogenesis protein CcdC [Paenibacillus sp. P26]|nr:cytochrome c biogenesis protein CcdC [Paenibacillus sp. P26]UUZ90991.1 cytochrome c biogenesis protein CcdC [Paenibacillus sp. P25]